MRRRTKKRVARVGLLIMTLIALGIGLCIGGALLVGLIQVAAPAVGGP